MDKLNILLIIIISSIAFSCIEKKQKIAQSEPIDYCQCNSIERNDGTTVLNCNSLPIASDNNFEIGVSISSNGFDYFISALVRFKEIEPLNFLDTLAIRTNHNDLLLFNLVNKSITKMDNEDVAVGIFLIDSTDYIKLMMADIKTISFNLENKKLHTLECSQNSSIIREQLECNLDLGQRYVSEKYGYSIYQPSGFTLTEANAKNIDYKIVAEDKSNILLNVSRRLPEEYEITAHDYSIELIQTMYRNSKIEISILEGKKSMINGTEAFIVKYLSNDNDTEVLEAFLYKGDHAYVLTATAKQDLFKKYEDIFLKTIYSLKTV